MKNFKMPKGSVKFKIGSIEQLPYDAEQVELYMVSGDPSIYIVPISEIPSEYTKIKFDEGYISKSYESFEDLAAEGEFDFQIKI